MIKWLKKNIFYREPLDQEISFRMTELAAERMLELKNGLGLKTMAKLTSRALTILDVCLEKTHHGANILIEGKDMEDVIISYGEIIGRKEKITTKSGPDKKTIVWRFKFSKTEKKRLNDIKDNHEFSSISEIFRNAMKLADKLYSFYLEHDAKFHISYSDGDKQELIIE